MEWLFDQCAKYSPEAHQKPKRSRFHIIFAVLVIGFFGFLALPNKVEVWGSEENWTIAQAEAMNIAIASFIQAHGREKAEMLWTAEGATTDTRYQALRPYLAYAPEKLSEYLTGTNYFLTLPTTLVDAGKVRLIKITRRGVRWIRY